MYNSFSEKFPITTYPLYDDYFLEKIHIYYILESESANIVVNIRKDNNGSPGEILEGASWDISLSGHGIAGAVEEYIFYTTSDCVYLEKDEFYLNLLARKKLGMIKEGEKIYKFDN